MLTYSTSAEVHLIHVPYSLRTDVLLLNNKLFFNKNDPP